MPVAVGTPSHPKRGTRPVRIANCSGGQMDPGWQMKKQASLGPVDVLTGDWLAENNLAQEAIKIENGTGEGFKDNAWDALQQSMGIIVEKRLKVVINGGGLKPQTLAERCQELVDKNNYPLTVAYVYGDNMAAQSENVLACNAYLGARGIVKALENGADIVIWGRVADASPVVGAAWWWYGWKDTEYDQLAGAFVTGHLVECCAYVSGSNFSGFTRFPMETFIDSGFPIAEIHADGSSVITKHEGTNGMVTVDTVKSQLIYEIQGNIYLNSDVSAVLDGIVIKQEGKDRVRVTGAKGRPPPPTTKLAIYYRGGYESQHLGNAAGYATKQKYALYEKQLRARLAEQGLIDHVGTAKKNPHTQFEATTYFRTFAQAATPEPILKLKMLISDETLQHFSGFHWAEDQRTSDPRTFYVYYPCVIAQDDIEEGANILGTGGKIVSTHPSTRPPEPNINCGIFVERPEMWEWFRSFMTMDRMKQLIGGDWKDEYRIERVEFPAIYAVHFVMYGMLGRGVSSSSLLDNRGKGFTDYIRAKHIEVPEQFLQWAYTGDE
ncbi:uncharacterized protein NECHADRAFT_97888 [Fusarium vanettenii 77-13-4]|uniref:DUF1446-domain-containing protein n=1 Tax=Fusarium vanettenii (strain ATCC MYA-4622 / CBS 123669 / FGSC 9596 / NRRL 45880 / 77-13-4) TaxID=660122 RepID=C7ZJT8_FUSV7|nr:uncharacterized protein NECHADRAFT_97888 [Fusarium vanettenii 77-13-4]EEU35687.1 hypothetical protein NECHADRAFT_97888 [Fusarium vanettenii 77-13-4]